ncbi:S8 family serine peptidase [Paraburkholderia sp. LEh10]|uniref:S8 family serine peptidase n=1 Tax=Paraburkholderia sp. LEh10 TaxID=2821353 RepID=UPI001AE78F2E|nr:S8 family serine peptidase [Paraburkholderia sp. LEh10]MBP0589672.1 S8 family serine peptidase [Paraburkholderia sp. LEh10]
MKAYDPHDVAARPARGDSHEELRVAITFNRPGQHGGPTRFGARMSTDTVASFIPDPAQADLALAELARRGFTLTGRGSLSASMRCTPAQFEALFQTRLKRMKAPCASAAQFGSVLYPPDGAPWNPDPAIQSLLDDVYIQWPHIYMAKAAKSTRAKKTASTAAKKRPAAPKQREHAAPSATPPAVPYFHLAAPADIALHLNATPVHQQGITGKGVRIAMIDSGFAHGHPYFKAHGYSSSIVLAPGATDRRTDANGHGTGESANIFAIAPGATFIGVKLDNDTDPTRGASVLEGLQEALKHDPHVISVSLGYDLRGPDNTPLATLPNGLVALEAEIQAAVKRGVVIVFSAGNGHYSFPGQMPDIISAGGVFVDSKGAMRASDYASAFTSAIYSGRSVPDVCGLVGLLPHATYISLPVSPGCEIDRENAAFDGTTPDDGWGVFSGTSAAAPQLAGLCALLLQANPRLSPGDVKAILRRTARDVTKGHANPASDPKGAGVPAGLGEDGATGAGLVDALAAVRQL